MDAPLKDYAVTIRIRNNWMLKAMERAGFKTGADLSRACGVDQTKISQMLGLQTLFLNKKGQWKPSVLAVSEALKCLPGDIIPPQHWEKILEKNSGTFEASYEEVETLLESQEHLNPLQLVEHQECGVALKNAMDKRLTARERLVLIMRFGLEGEKEHTFDECAEALNVGRERIRQIECKAIRKLRLGGYAPAKPGKAIDMRSAEILAEFAK